ncbi:hypothetical protein ABH941_002713 [Streptacidiphilus sp. EB103A]
MRLGSGAERFAVGGGGAPRLQRQRVVGRAARRFPGSARKEAAPSPSTSCRGYPMRDNGRGWPRSGAERSPGARGGGLRARRSGVGEVQPHPGECWTRSASRIYPRPRPDFPSDLSQGHLSGLAGCWGELHPRWGAQQPYMGVIHPSMVVTPPSTGNPARRKVSAAPVPARTRQRTPHQPPPPRGCREAEPSHPSPAPTDVPHGGDGRSAGAIAHVGDGGGTGARPGEGSRCPDGGAPPPPTALLPDPQPCRSRCGSQASWAACWNGPPPSWPLKSYTSIALSSFA